MAKRIAILDYGVGNLLSIKRAIERFDIQTIMVDHSSKLPSCDGLVLPGVGAFRDGMAGLERFGFIDIIKKYVNDGYPLLGICLGMQLLFESSEEFGHCLGLGLIAGTVEKLPAFDLDHSLQRVPHVGWSSVVANKQSLFLNLPSNLEYYFCHSYEVNPTQSECNIAYYEYGGRKVVAAVNHDRIYGFQFHPEKSGIAGLLLLKNFLQEIQVI